MNDIFFDDLGKEELPKKKPIQKKIQATDVFEKLRNRVEKKKRIKTSVFASLDKKTLEQISLMIFNRQMTYRVALDKLRLLYKNNKELQTVRHETLRYYLIKHGYIENEKALKTINKSISNSGYAKNKREKIVSDVLKELSENDFEIILNNENFKRKLKEIIKKL